MKLGGALAAKITDIDRQQFPPQIDYLALAHMAIYPISNTIRKAAPKQHSSSLYGLLQVILRHFHLG